MHLTSTLSPPHGYHPVSHTLITYSTQEFDSACTLHLHYVLPALAFVDPYELAHHDAAYTFRHWGPSNLELPVAALKKEHNASLHGEGSHILLDVKREDQTRDETERQLEVHLPLHLRYGDPRKASASRYHEEELAWPIGFFACPRSHHPDAKREAEVTLPPTLGALFDSRTSVLLPIPPFPASTHPGPMRVRVPTASPAHRAPVELGTALVVLLACAWVAHAAYRAVGRIGCALARGEKTD
ncbi:hypothetical protein H0H81_001553 [Sphagnurus paluster]|uniref:Protein PBN1 n=1 Tax=Sphagnurus paluster TaxID=117069 RepID=A0A9P7FMJ6_9AGAR|nr:hypothetical protein H0H81_001553 [Sphagnurus paluster]